MPKEKKEMVYVIPLKRVYWGRRTNRAARAVKLVRQFVARHFGVEPEKVWISNEVNEYIWQFSIEKPPRRVKVYVVKDEEAGLVRVYLARKQD
ncbi:Ribosomal protein L31e [Pyrolobus fumarii 1A]|uniref:Large ribosomal subunit protein eL31 n=1 Tax=Pyrolobus fumarii (strain DSM 11204 / 1A) TaxID=694429 RepID=G0EEM7_PYRF1|nr:50S ribosomal protein L31e [Pyrolobus fumarii]AEM38849.1 Ribosomal protein L31e [Pyrolobus fumarii 1A]